MSCAGPGGGGVGGQQESGVSGELKGTYRDKRGPSHAQATRQPLRSPDGRRPGRSFQRLCPCAVPVRCEASTRPLVLDSGMSPGAT